MTTTTLTTDDPSSSVASPTPITSAEWEERATTIAAELRPGASAADVSGQLDAAAFDRIRAAGLTSALVPTEFGGGGATYADMAMILRRLAAGDPAVAVTLAMHSHLV